MGAVVADAQDMEREVGQFAIEHARNLLTELGIDCETPGVMETPRRLVRALRELTRGLHEDPAQILKTVFDVGCDELVIVRDIPFVSVCEHHIMPFTGVMTVGYLPTRGRVVGLSKIPRLVHCFARRPQIQERLTRDVAEALLEHVKPAFVGVVCKATHSCMKLRGVQSDGQMLTSCILPPPMRTTAVRDEFLRFAT